jgi:hypothetical protein
MPVRDYAVPRPSPFYVLNHAWSGPVVTATRNRTLRMQAFTDVDTSVSPSSCGRPVLNVTRSRPAAMASHARSTRARWQDMVPGGESIEPRYPISIAWYETADRTLPSVSSF